jgi:hypothetical protein
MLHRVSAFITAAAIIGGGCAYAQDNTAGPGVVEATVIPGGLGFFASKNEAPSFGNYGGRHLQREPSARHRGGVRRDARDDIRLAVR